MKYGIDIGHNSPPDTGARGIKFEDNLVVDVGNRVISKLQALGHEVIPCKPDRSTSVRDSLSQRCNKANAARVEVFVSIHCNAFNGRANGTEVFAASNAGRRIAQPVLNEIVKLGFFNRGVKNGSHLFVLRNTNMPAILVECCFIDSQKDMNIFDPEATANAIVKGLTGKLPSVPVNAVPDEEQNIDTSVMRLQRSLNRLKITDRNGKPLVENNQLNTETKYAIEKFQEIVGIEQTGIVGETTWSVINQILAKRIIRRSHSGGPVVRYIQYRVGADADGIFGPQTEAAIKRFQRRNGLVPDAIVGPATWQRLIG